MSSAATGSFGALLMIAPLAAIPVFAIVGMPRFSSMVAAPSDAEEVYDYEPALDEDTPASQKIRSKSPDDLYAPFDDQDSKRPLKRRRSSAEVGSDSVREVANRDQRNAGPRSLAERRSVGSLGGNLGDDDEIAEDETRTRPADQRFSSSSTGRSRRPRAEESDDVEFDTGLVHPPKGGAGIAGRSARSSAMRGNNSHLRRLENEEANLDEDGADFSTNSRADEARWRTARKQIKKLGITWHQLSPEEDREGRLMFVFTCFVTAPGEPSHRYSASGQSPIDAVETTLKKVAELTQ